MIDKLRKAITGRFTGSPEMDKNQEIVHLHNLIRELLPYAEREEKGTRTSQYTRWLIAAASKAIE